MRVSRKSFSMVNSCVLMCAGVSFLFSVRGISQAARGFCCERPKGIQICSYAFRTLVSGFHSAALCDPARDTQVCPCL